MSTSKPKIRCAIYTRKSSDEGLDQEFNSLDAQYDACASYIASQKHEGWKAIAQRYDDGGISGGTMERPGLQRLLHDIDAGLIDMVVIYKIDRLTRSLADFARLVERLDQHGCSFVSVTQAFNTSTSMGRLTLNVLLSFAQFEREVTAERIRDKISASKQKGMWMGGLPPLGYDPHPDKLVRSLVVNEPEAAVVRTFFDLYRRLGNLRQVENEAKRLGLLSKRRVDKTGRVSGDRALSRGQIYYLLTNPIYKGEIRHKGTCYPGQHAAIITAELWDDVQMTLQEVSVKARGSKANAKAPSLPPSESLKGKLFDETGDRLTPSHTLRKGKSHRYYVSNRLISGGVDPSGWRLPAGQLECALRSAIAHHIQMAAQSFDLVTEPTSEDVREVNEAAAQLIERLQAGSDKTMAALLTKATLHKGWIDLDLSGQHLSRELGVAEDRLPRPLTQVRLPFSLRKRGIETKLVAGALKQKPDPALLGALSKAETWLAQIKSGIQISEIAASHKCSESNIRKQVQLAFLSPDLKLAILEGRHPVTLTLETLVRYPIPRDWSEQRKRYQETTTW